MADTITKNEARHTVQTESACSERKSRAEGSGIRSLELVGAFSKLLIGFRAVDINIVFASDQELLNCSYI